jgi:peptidoglycan/LPS O-acetylase OafA/YrhL
MLDLIRITAAIVVAFGHISQHYFSAGWPDFTFLARCAVAVFFVLSGFVIRYITCRRPSTLRHYLGDRASRIYSIAIPALLFTFFTDSVARHVNPSFYAPWAANYQHPVSRIVLNLTFVARLWNLKVEALSNTPFWSLCYEAIYYMIYGCAFYLTGWRRWLCVAIVSLAAGPAILYLFPLWISGCVLHDLYQRWNLAHTAGLNLLRSYLAALALGAVAHLARHSITIPTHLGNHSGFVHFFVIQPLNIFENLFGFAWTLLFMGLLLIARKVEISASSRFSRLLHFISEGTFPIYLLHLPLYVLAAALIRYNHASPAPKLLILFGVLVIGVLAGHPGNLLKKKLRSLNSTPEPDIHPLFLQGQSS